MSLASYFQSAAANSKSGSPLSRYTDIALVAGIVAIIALMIVPLPNWAIDILVAVNISGGILLLLLAIYISSPLEFSVFPSVLLISTLFRLALSIATTRMILLHGEAGHIIQTFGDMVAGGNLVVGLVVFLIITVVQLRSGLIDKDEARRRRRMLENESKLNGSLDGAMKFVKGDAIAGIIIIIINLLGGLTIGVLQQDMTLSDATVKYSILTIGDGMVSQIPALLGAMSAGLLVTRTTDDEHDKHLGDAIGRQLTAKPRVLLMGGGLCVLFSAVPGFPTVVFMALGLAFFAAGFMLTPSLRARWEKLAQPTLSAVMRRSPTAPVLMSAEAVQVRPTVPLLLEVPVGRLDAQESHSLLAGLEGVLDHFQLNLGMRLPRIDVHAMRPDEDKPAVWRLLAYEVPIAEGELQQEDTVPSLVNEVRESLRRHVNLFMGTQEANLLLTRAAIDLPDVVKETLRALPLARVAEILRRLVEEEVAIRNLRDILETLADTAQREKDVYALTELTRIGLKRQISHRYAPDGHLRAVLLEPALEEMLRNAIRHNSGAQQLALDPLEMSRLMTRFRNVVQVFKPAAIVTAVDIRRHVRKLIEQDCFDIPVLSYHELLPSLQLEALHRVSTEDAPLLEAGS